MNFFAKLFLLLSENRDYLFISLFITDDGISIPSSYTNYVVPVSAPKLYSEIAQMREKDKHPLVSFISQIFICN